MNKPPEHLDEDAPATAEEEAAARSLADALEGAAPGKGAASPELDTAALLRQARPEAAGAAVDERVLARVLPALEARRAGGRRRWWIWPAVLVPVAAVALVFGSLGTLSSPAPIPASPPPSLALLETQASAARGQRQALAALDAQMRQYRAAYYRARGQH